MSIHLSSNAYGKNAINLSKIIRHKDRHELRHVSVNVILEGDFETVHTEGDNSKVLPTDTQKNTVHALAKDHLISSIEAFGIVLADHFMSNNPQLSKTTIELTEHNWARISIDGGPHPTAFLNGGSDKHYARIVKSGTGVTVFSGIKDLLILKTTDSAFKGYIKDNYTTLKETDDRILCTSCEAIWEYTTADFDFDVLYRSIRESLLATFAEHHSLSVQHTLYAMGEQVLKQYETVQEISLNMPNKHHIAVNLEPFGIRNESDVFMATEEPYGYITGTVKR